MKIGILCPPGTGHLNAMNALGYELQQRGHKVTLLRLPDVKSSATAAKLEFYLIGAAKFPLGSNKRSRNSLRFGNYSSGYFCLIGKNC